MQILNIFVDDIGASQLSYSIVTQFNSFLKENNLDVTLFYINMHTHCMTPNFSVMEVVESWDQQGVGIATSFSTVEKLLLCPRIKPKILYLWDLDFLRFYPKIYSVAQNIICNSNIEIICQSQSHASLVKNNFNREIKHIVRNFDLGDLFLSLCKIDKQQNWDIFLKDK